MKKLVIILSLVIALILAATTGLFWPMFIVIIACAVFYALLKIAD